MPHGVPGSTFSTVRGTREFVFSFTDASIASIGQPSLFSGGVRDYFTAVVFRVWGIAACGFLLSVALFTLPALHSVLHNSADFASAPGPGALYEQRMDFFFGTDVLLVSSRWTSSQASAFDSVMSMLFLQSVVGEWYNSGSNVSEVASSV